MVNRLQQKWKVSAGRFALIIITFAVGGSLTGYAGRRIMYLFGIDNPVFWLICYLALITLIWPLAVLLVSIPMGQFIFFRKYLMQMGKRIGATGTKKKLAPGTGTNHLPTIAIFASGTGTNAARIIDYTHRKNHDAGYHVGLIICNKQNAGVLRIASEQGIPAIIIEKEKFFRGNAYVDELRSAGIDFIVLAGFLWKIPPALVAAYRNRIINIHPALLPKYGGKGMYGQFVHEAVIENKDAESGITIHWVDEHYDHGSVIFQATCPLLPGDTPETLAGRIHQLEHRHYPEVIGQLVAAMVRERSPEV